MSDLKCPFTTPLVQQDACCSNACEVVRRGGAEIACQKQDAHGECVAVHDAIKQSALRALDCEDNLLSLPHSVLVKVQYGGIAGMHLVLSGQTAGTAGSDVSALVQAVLGTYPGLEGFPYAETDRAVSEYSARKRGRRRA